MPRTTIAWLCLLLLLIGVAPPPTGAQDNGVIQNLGERADDFFSDLETTDPQRVFNDFLRGSPLEQRSDQVKQLIEQVRQLDSLYGSYVEAERITARTIGDKGDLVVMKYLYKTDRYPLIWHFAFYRPPSLRDERGWTVVAVGFSSRVESLIDLPPRTGSAE